MNWIKHEGYDEKHQYVDDNGKIVAEVTGSNFHTDRGWYVSDERSIPHVNKGRYVSLQAAQEAVENLLRVELRKEYLYGQVSAAAKSLRHTGDNETGLRIPITPGSEWLVNRCGHNYVAATCPYERCGFREALEALAELKDSFGIRSKVDR